jgi:hypothetical protein
MTSKLTVPVTPAFTVCPSPETLANALDAALALSVADEAGYDATVRRLSRSIHRQEFCRFASLYLAVVLLGHATKPTCRLLTMKTMDIDILDACQRLGEYLTQAQRLALESGNTVLSGHLSDGISRELSQLLLSDGS